jgi:hypothetical protein
MDPRGAEGSNWCRRSQKERQGSHSLVPSKSQRDRIMTAITRWVAVPLTLLATACTVQARTSPAPEAEAVAQQPSSPGPSTAARLGITPGHLPPPGQCRIWTPGDPPGRQAHRPSRCEGLESIAPAGSWIVYRPGRNKKIVEVRQIDRISRGVIVGVRVYEAQTGRLLRIETGSH